MTALLLICVAALLMVVFGVFLALEIRALADFAAELGSRRTGCCPCGGTVLITRSQLQAASRQS